MQEGTEGNNPFNPKQAFYDGPKVPPDVQFVYALKDSRAELFLPPFIARTDAEAKRMMARMCSQDGLVKQFPDDFVLWRLGTMDTGTGFLVACNTAALCSVKSLLGGEGA